MSPGSKDRRHLDLPHNLTVLEARNTMNMPKPIDTLRASMKKNSSPILTRRCSRELENLLATASSPMLASASMPGLHRTRSLTKRSSSGKLARRAHSSKGVKYLRRRSSDKLPGPNAEFDTFGDSSVSGTTTSSLLIEKVERAITGNSPKKAPEPKRSEAEAPQPPAEPPRLTTTTPLPPSAARNAVPDDASSTVTQQRPKTLHSPRITEHQVAKANIKYKNEAGRAAVLAVCETLHHDFGQLNNIINVTLPASELESLAENPDVVWIDRSGAVYFMQPYRSAK